MADCASLERTCAGNGTEGSNPSLSAIARHCCQVYNAYRTGDVSRLRAYRSAFAVLRLQMAAGGAMFWYNCRRKQWKD